MNNYDIVILGGGPGGYTAAIRAAQLDKRVALVEKEKLGGTCLHKGCIPSKTLLRSAELFETMKRSRSFGIVASDITIDFEGVLSRKDTIVKQLHAGVQFLMKKNEIAVFQGYGTIAERRTVDPGSCNGLIEVSNSHGEIVESIGYTDLIIATGSRPRRIPGLPQDERIMTSDDALAMKALPGSVIIVGGGVIGVEWASMLADFGVQVTIIEAAERLVPTEDTDISRELARLFTKRRIKTYTSAKMVESGVSVDHNGITVTIEHGGRTEILSAERMLVSIGRIANIDGFGLERLGISVERSCIVVDDTMSTTEPHIYAVGDVIGGLQLAHVASHEGVTAVEHICGMETHALIASTVPKCIYSHPEMGSVGLTEQAAIEAGFKVKIGKFSFKAIGKALVFGDSDGFVKVVAEEETGTILGVHMIGPHVTEFISEAALAQLMEATSMQIGRMIHPHPSLSEIMSESMLSVDRLALGM